MQKMLNNVKIVPKQCLRYSNANFLISKFLSSGQQIRSKIDSLQNAHFLISQPNPMMFHSLESSRRDDFNEGHIKGLVEK